MTIRSGDVGRIGVGPNIVDDCLLCSSKTVADTDNEPFSLTAGELFVRDESDVMGNDDAEDDADKILAVEEAF